MKRTTNRHYAYDKKWEELFPITQVKSDRHAYYCVPCDRENSCACNGIRNVQAHCRSLIHMRKVKEENSRKQCAESVGHISPESAVGPPLAECSHDGIDMNVPVPNRDTYGRFLSKKKEHKVSEISPKQQTLSTTPADDANVNGLCQKPEYSRCLDRSAGMATDCNLAMRLNIKLELKRIKEGKFGKK